MGIYAFAVPSDLWCSPRTYLLSPFNKSIKLRYTSPANTQFIGQHIIYEAVCASTNSLAAQYLGRKELSDGTVIITDHQYQVRGQRGHQWHSEPHQNLTFSVILYPTFLNIQQSFVLNIIASLAIQYVLALYVPSDLRIKWPNDIYHQNKKVGGVLIENMVGDHTLKTAIVGIGLNVNQTSFTLPTPTSLSLICQRTFRLQRLLEQIFERLESTYLQCQAQGLASLREVYLSHMYWMHEVHTFRDVNHTFQGIIRGIDALGKLIIEHSDGVLQHYSMQAVTFIA